ncbi:unnamed protein product [Sphenostylis stenocarpa]|uniref:Uncharacterized protein n=1 Tax=Sphenostylis stenocarpa TaxID=92480 RepID=A0AA86VUP9_9FABA|nr:unnamed protein product [Sphenostylis stenocarpa]
MAAKVLKETKSMTAAEMAAETAETVVSSVKCCCCGLVEECTHAYIGRVKEKYGGRWICGLCAEAVKEERERENHDNNRRSAEATHEVLPTVQLLHSSRQHQRGFHPRRQTDPVPNFGFSKERPFQLSPTWEISQLLLNHARNA